MKYAFEMCSGAMSYTPSFTKIGSGIQQLGGGIHIQTQTHKQKGDIISLLLYFENKESRLKIQVSRSPSK
jgi:hypothetical protein